MGIVDLFSDEYGPQIYSRAPPIPPKVPFSPVKSPVVYTTILDFSPAIQTPLIRPFTKKHSTNGIRPTVRFEDTPHIHAGTRFSPMSSWRNGLARQTSIRQSEGCEFESRRGCFFFAYEL
jgi:hypothetical protein